MTRFITTSIVLPEENPPTIASIDWIYIGFIERTCSHLVAVVQVNQRCSPPPRPYSPPPLPPGGRRSPPSTPPCPVATPAWCPWRPCLPAWSTPSPTLPAAPCTFCPSTRWDRRPPSHTPTPSATPTWTGRPRGTASRWGSRTGPWRGRPPSRPPAAAPGRPVARRCP